MGQPHISTKRQSSAINLCPDRKRTEAENTPVIPTQNKKTNHRQTRVPRWVSHGKRMNLEALWRLRVRRTRQTLASWAKRNPENLRYVEISWMRTLHSRLLVIILSFSWGNWSGTREHNLFFLLCNYYYIIIIYSSLLSLCNRLGYERPTPHLF
jgi:hypothetical protein